VPPVRAKNDYTMIMVMMGLDIEVDEHGVV